MKHEAPNNCLLAAVLLFLAFECSGCATGGIEKPNYTVEQTDGDFDVRAYTAQVVAETRVQGTLEEAGDQAFRPLFRYIGHLIEPLHENDPLRGESIHDLPVVYDLVQTVDRAGADPKGGFNRLDRAPDPGAETVRIGNDDRSLFHTSRFPETNGIP